MAENTKIEWTDATWTIVQGCDPYSQGCVGCYAVPLLWRMSHNPDPKISVPLQGLVEKHVNRAGETILRFTGRLALREDRLSWPLDWKTPRMIFVPSHGDIFHKDVPDAFLDKVFDVMERADWHTFQVLTKRSRRMLEYVNRRYADRAPAHIWFMVSAEDQPNADERIPDLLATKAAVRGVSLEPLIGPIDLRRIRDAARDEAGAEFLIDALTGMAARDGQAYVASIDFAAGVKPAKLDWIIVGGESGKNARPMHPDWARSLRDQCAAAGKPDRFFFKQHGEWIGVPDLRNLPGGAGPGFGAFDHCKYDMSADCVRVGKKKAGRLLDGVEHNGMPEARI